MRMEKDWNFDEVIDRRSTGSMKWEPAVLREKFGPGGENLLPLWVADMDFKTPDFIVNAIKKGRSVENVL